MKIQKTKKYISAVAVVAIVLTAGTLYTVQSSVQQDVAQAYTSPQSIHKIQPQHRILML